MPTPYWPLFPQINTGASDPDHAQMWPMQQPAAKPITPGGMYGGIQQPQPYRPQQGSQSAAYRRQNPGVPNAAPQIAAAPIADMSVERQPQPGEQATGSVLPSTQTALPSLQTATKPPNSNFLEDIGDGFQEAFADYTPSDWLQMGLSLLAGSQNGGDWSVVQQGFGQLANTREQRKRYETEQQRLNRQEARQARQDAMAEELHPLSVESTKAQILAAQNQNTWGAEDRLLAKDARAQGMEYAKNILEGGQVKDPTALAMFQLASRGVLPVQDALARMAGIDDRMSNQAHEEEMARLQAQRDDARMRNQVDIAAQKQLEMDALQRNRNNYNETITRQGSLNNLNEARSYITSLIGSGKNGKLGIDTNQTLSQLFDPPEVEAILQNLKALAVDRGIGLLKSFGGNDTDKEFQLALDTIGNPAATLRSQLDMIDRQIGINEEAINRFGEERKWAEENGNIYARNKSGQAFTDYYYGKGGPGAKRNGTTVDSAARMEPFKLSAAELGSTPGARITVAIQGLQGAKTVEAYDRAVAALSNMPKDELAKAMAQVPRTRFSYAGNTPRGDSGLVYGAY